MDPSAECPPAATNALTLLGRVVLLLGERRQHPVEQRDCHKGTYEIGIVDPQRPARLSRLADDVKQVIERHLEQNLADLCAQHALEKQPPDQAFTSPATGDAEADTAFVLEHAHAPARAGAGIKLELVFL